MNNRMRWSKNRLHFAVISLCALGILLISGCGPSSDEITVSVIVENTEDLGSIHLELVYDPDILEPTEVKIVGLAKTALVQEDMRTPGRVMIGIVDDSGINGNGVLVEVICNAVDDDGFSVLQLENVTAHNADTLMDIGFTLSHGIFSADDNDVVSPVVQLLP